MTHIENIERKILLKPSSICIGGEELAEVELLCYPTNCNLCVWKTDGSIFWCLPAPK